MDNALSYVHSLFNRPENKQQCRLGSKKSISPSAGLTAAFESSSLLEHTPPHFSDWACAAISLALLDPNRYPACHSIQHDPRGSQSWSSASVIQRLFLRKSCSDNEEISKISVSTTDSFGSTTIADVRPDHHGRFRVWRISPLFRPNASTHSSAGQVLHVSRRHSILFSMLPVISEFSPVFLVVWSTTSRHAKIYRISKACCPRACQKHPSLIGSRGSLKRQRQELQRKSCQQLQKMLAVIPWLQSSSKSPQRGNEESCRRYPKFTKVGGSTVSTRDTTSHVISKRRKITFSFVFIFSPKGLDFKRTPSLADELSQLEISSTATSLPTDQRHRQFFKPHIHYRGLYPWNIKISIKQQNTYLPYIWF